MRSPALRSGAARAPKDAHRFVINQPIQARLLPQINHPSQGPFDELFEGTLIELSARDAVLSLSIPVESGALVRIDWNQVTMFGELRRIAGSHQTILTLWHVAFSSNRSAVGWKQLFEG